MPNPSLSLVFIMCDEQETIADAIDEAMGVADAIGVDAEFVVVDDGSCDESPEIVRMKMSGDERIRLVQHPANRGIGAAMKTGIAAATKDVFTFLPADLQIPAAGLEVMLPLLDTADVVLTTYANRPNSRLRTLMSRALRLYMRGLAGIGFELEGLYLFPTEVGKSLLKEVHSETFFFSFELIQRGLDLGLSLNL